MPINPLVQKRVIGRLQGQGRPDPQSITQLAERCGRDLMRDLEALALYALAKAGVAALESDDRPTDLHAIRAPQMLAALKGIAAEVPDTPMIDLMAEQGVLKLG